MVSCELSMVNCESRKALGKLIAFRPDHIYSLKR